MCVYFMISFVCAGTGVGYKMWKSLVNVEEFINGLHYIMRRWQRRPPLKMKLK